MYPGTCIFGDVFDLIHNKIPEKSLLNVDKIKFKEEAFCVAHNKKCKFCMDEASMLVLGTPCVLFSKLHGRFVVFFSYSMSPDIRTCS